MSHLSLLRGSQEISAQGRLIIGGCDSWELAQKFGTPLYLVDEDLLRANCRAYLSALAKHYPHQAFVAYAAKAFLVKALCPLLESEGLYLDVASAGELYTALQARFPANKILLHGNFKTEKELSMALEYKLHRVVVDNLDELQELQALAKKRDQKAEILLRITPGIEAHTHDYIKTGHLDTKFGIPIIEGRAFEATMKALEMSHIKLRGFHFHLGSQIFDLEPFAVAAEQAFEFLNSLRPRTTKTFPELDMGGGLGIRYVNDQNPPNIEEYIRVLCRALVKASERHNYPLPSLILEPGRSIIGETGVTLYSIGSVKEIPGLRNFVAVDGGISDNPRPALYGAMYHVMVANKGNEPPNYLATIAGKHCESDILFKDVKIAKPTKGDLLAVFSTGAYHHSMASNYNRYPRPAVVLTRQGKAKLIYQRESLEELLRNDV